MKICARFALLALAAASLPATTINDVDSPGYVTGNSNYTGVVRINLNAIGGSSSICSGVLVNASQIVTAGHCVSGMENWSVTFETASGTTALGVQSTLLHPLYGPRPAPVNNITQYDIAILNLVGLAPSDAQIYSLGFGLNPLTQVVGQLAQMVGYGRGGSVATGFLSSGTRRVSENEVSGILTSLNGVTTPDLPWAIIHTFGTEAPSHGLTAPGDSGGALLIGNYLVGITSFGTVTASGGITVGPHLAGFANIFEAQTQDFLFDNLVPEPTTYLLMASGLLVLGLARRRSSPSLRRPV